jgi:flagellar biosynthesis GTPase FlhF
MTKREKERKTTMTKTEKRMTKREKEAKAAMTKTEKKTETTREKERKTEKETKREREKETKTEKEMAKKTTTMAEMTMKMKEMTMKMKDRTTQAGLPQNVILLTRTGCSRLRYHLDCRFPSRGLIHFTALSVAHVTHGCPGFRQREQERCAPLVSPTIISCMDCKHQKTYTSTDFLRRLSAFISASCGWILGNISD